MVGRLLSEKSGHRPHDNCITNIRCFQQKSKRIGELLPDSFGFTGCKLHNQLFRWSFPSVFRIFLRESGFLSSENLPVCTHFVISGLTSVCAHFVTSGLTSVCTCFVIFGFTSVCTRFVIFGLMSVSTHSTISDLNTGWQTSLPSSASSTSVEPVSMFPARISFAMSVSALLWRYLLRGRAP